MKKLISMALLTLSVSACSGMQGMQSSGGVGGTRGYPQFDANSTTYPVTDPETGQLTFYHGG